MDLTKSFVWGAGILSLFWTKTLFFKLPKLVKSFDYLVKRWIVLSSSMPIQRKYVITTWKKIFCSFPDCFFDCDCTCTTFLQHNLRFAKQQKETRNHQSWKQQKTTQTDRYRKTWSYFFSLFHLQETFNFEGNLTWKLNPALTALTD